MKKIVGIIAAVAMATSVFAADVAARVKVGNKLFNSADKTVLTTPASDGWDVNNTFFKFSTSSDNAGASMFVSKGADAQIYNLAVWFKPIDSLKITVGSNSIESIVNGTFAWWAKSARIEDKDGVRFEFTSDALTINFLSFANPLLSLDAEGYAKLGNFWLDGRYNLGDAGNIQLFVTKGADINAYGVGGWESAGLAIGVAYNNMPWQQTGYYADVLINLADAKEFEGVASQIGGQYCADGLALRLTNMIGFGTHYGAKDGDKYYFDYGFVAKASYAIDAYTPYLQVMGHEIMSKKCGLELGMDTSFGACAFNIAFSTTLDFNEGSKFTFEIPMHFDVQF
jgi:hypothetical protein